MGYYSEVSLTVYEKDYKKLLDNAASNANTFSFLVKSCQTYKSNDTITMIWNYVKWYSEFPEIKYVENFMRSGVEYCFRRVGEETGDIEVCSNEDDYYLSEKTDVITEIDFCNAGDEINPQQYAGIS